MGAMAAKHIGDGIHRLIVNAAGVFIATRHGVPHRRATDDDERQLGVHLLHQRHHRGRRARCGNSKEAAQFPDDAVERGNGHGRQLRVLAQQRTVQITHIQRPYYVLIIFNHACKGTVFALIRH